MHVARQAQLQREFPGSDFLPDGVGDVDDVADPVGVVRKQGAQLLLQRRRGRGHFGEMQRQLHTVLFGARERGAVDGDVAFCGIAAEVDADDAARAVSDGEVDDLHGFGGVVGSVDGEDEVGGHFVVGGGGEGGDAVEDEGDVVRFGDVAGGDGARGGA